MRVEIQELLGSIEHRRNASLTYEFDIRYRAVAPDEERRWTWKHHELRLRLAT